jgi:hypothetical protein
MSQVIVYTSDEGTLHICIPTPEYLVDHTIEDVLAKDCPAHAIIVDRTELPQADADFTDSWELVDGKVLVNFGKAQEQTKTRLRIERESLLAAQDVAFQRALESGADTSAIVAEKQRLRDITKLADTATTLDELRAITV